MVAKRWGVWLLCLGGVACWGGEPGPRAAARVAEPLPAGPMAAVAPEAGEGEAALRGVLTDADLAAVAAGGPTPPATSPEIPEAPLPRGAVLALETTAVDATDDLSISLGDARAEELGAALDAASLMGEPLPAPGIAMDLGAVPAAPAPDL